MRTPAWTRGDLVLAGGVVVGLAAVADTARTLYEQFAVDLTGLSALERAGVALWDFRPLAPAVFAAAAVALLLCIDVRPLPLLAAFCAAYAVLGLAVLGLAGWIAAAGSVGGPDELGFVFTRGERVTTAVTQGVAWGPLAVLFAVLAARATEPREPEQEEQAPPEGLLLSAEMEALWRGRLAYGPQRERARRLLGRIRELEEAGDAESAAALADEMRRL